MELAKDLVYCACCGAPMVLHNVGCGGKGHLMYVCSNTCGRVRMIRADELDEAIVGYLRALVADDTRKQLDKALADSVKAHSEHVRKTRGKRLKELRAIAEDFTVPEDIRKVLKGCCIQLGMTIPEQVQPQRKEVTAAGYYCKPVPESLEADPEGMRQAAEWYIRRVTVHATSIEFTSTIDDWLRKSAPELYPVWITPYLRQG